MFRRVIVVFGLAALALGGYALADDDAMRALDCRIDGDNGSAYGVNISCYTLGASDAGECLTMCQQFASEFGGKKKVTLEARPA